MKKKILKTLSGIIVAALFLFLALRGQPLNEIFQTVLGAKFGYVFIAMLFYFMSYVARSEKWRIQVENLNFKVVPKTAFYALMLHFFVNSFTIKLGGFVRCGNLRKTANVPFPSCFGSYLSECVYDFLFMFIGLFIILSIKFNEILLVLTNFIADLALEKYFSNPLFIVIAVLISFVGFFAGVYLYTKGLIFKKYKTKIKEFLDSLKKTFNLKKFWLFILWNIVLWVMLYFMNYFLFLSLFNEKKEFIFLFTITTFSYAAWLMPNPGGIGSVEYFVLQAFLLFGLSSESALAFGILSNGFTLISTLLFGFSLIVIQSLFGIFLQKNKNSELEKVDILP
ncbi:MAG: flippase-like domain-containing protein [Bacteroidales bacterium]|nr:flippase-like domain-containing protein [Bacteroidales bacterium]